MLSYLIFNPELIRRVYARKGYMWKSVRPKWWQLERWESTVPMLEEEAEKADVEMCDPLSPHQTIMDVPADGPWVMGKPVLVIDMVLYLRMHWIYFRNNALKNGWYSLYKFECLKRDKSQSYWKFIYGGKSYSWWCWKIRHYGIKYSINLYFILLKCNLLDKTELRDYVRESQIFKKNKASGSFCIWDPKRGSCKKAWQWRDELKQNTCLGICEQEGGVGFVGWKKDKRLEGKLLEIKGSWVRD